MQPMPPEVALRHRAPGTYVINEVFYSLQGEGINAGVPMVFIRFADCNLRCARNNEARFDCDTEFMSGNEMTLSAIDGAIIQATSGVSSGSRQHPRWLLLTGGEPALQVDDEFMEYFDVGWNIAIETNGTIVLPTAFDVRPLPKSLRRTHVCISPKSGEHTLRRRRADEVKYVRRVGQGIPETVVHATHQLISPAAQADGSFLREDVEWCIKLVKENPEWRLSLQTHKLLNIR